MTPGVSLEEKQQSAANTAGQLSAMRKVERIRILYLIDQVFSTRGGVEQHIYWLLEKVPAQSFEKHFAVLSGALKTDVAQWPVTGVVISNNAGLGARNWWRRLKAVRQLIEQHSIDIVHTFCPMSELVAVCATRGGCSAKVIGVRRNTGYALSSVGAWRSWLISPGVSLYLTNSDAASRTAILREGISPERIAIINNPISSLRVDQKPLLCRRELAEDNEHIIAMVATVRPIKDYPTFLRAARIVLDKYEHVRFLAIGEHSPEITALQKLAVELGVASHFTWCGGVDNPVPILKHADVAVLTSRSESFSNAVLEYAASGIPAVVTDVGDLRRIVLDDESGYVVPPGSPAEIADRIMRLLADRTKRHAFGDRAKAHVSELFSEERVISQYLDTYRGLCS